MTKEEIVRNLKYVMKKHKDDRVNTFDINIYLMCKDILGYLEQEPCEDAISRQATIEAFQMFRGYEANRTNAEWVDRIETVVEKLPPVNSQEKTGHWKYYRNNKGDWVNECSVCGLDAGVGYQYPYCPNCGAKMVEPQESEG